MIILRGIEKRFANDVVALRGIDLCIRQGEAVAVLGASGSGKTTLMDIIGTLSKPSAGEYLLHGEKVAAFGDYRISRVRRDIFGYIFQSFNLIHDWTVKKNLQLAMRYRRKTHENDLRAALERINLADKLDAKVNTLSGGEQQRVAIVRTILRDPGIILADEPTGNLDIENAERVMDMLFTLHAADKTLIMITHSTDLASRFPRCIRLEKGRLLEPGP